MNELERQYIEWRTSCPWVYERFKQLAEERIRLNRRFGMQAAVERVRCDVPLETSRQRNRPCVEWSLRTVDQALTSVSGVVVNAQLDGQDLLAADSEKRTLYGGTRCYQSRSFRQLACRTRCTCSRTSCHSARQAAESYALGWLSCSGDRRYWTPQARQSCLPYGHFRLLPQPWK
jgi:hypothetical protein